MEFKKLTPASVQALKTEEFKKEFCKFWQCHPQTFNNYKKQYSEGGGKGMVMITHDATLHLLFNFRKLHMKDYTLNNINDLLIKDEKEKQNNKAK